MFLPAAGIRNYGSTSTVNNQGTNGYYWTSTPNDATNGYILNFNSGNVNPSNNNNYAYGQPVRCVR